jgi:hypothetical protein
MMNKDTYGKPNGGVTTMPLDDLLLDKYGAYYSSQYVAKNQPWILEVPFYEWVERQMSIRMVHLEGIEGYIEDIMQEPYPMDTVMLQETA